MKLKDFTLSIYEQLLLMLQNLQYSFLTFEEHCKGKATGQYVILRHDIDKLAFNALKMAEIEHSLGIRATYYFRILKQSNRPDIIRKIVGLGHEIGYHYEDLSITKGDQKAAIQHFEKQLQYFRQFYPVKTICMHGSPTSAYDNKDLWKTYDYRDYGIIGEPYFDLFGAGEKPAVADMYYLTDTGRMWNGERFSVRDKVNIQNSILNYRTTFELIDAIQSGKLPDKIMIITHPQRWTDNPAEWLIEYLSQTLKNQIKWLLLRLK